MQPFTTLRSKAVPLIRDNVDTDAIIPSREMKSVSKHGLADGLFAGWRYLDSATRALDPDFVLNRPQYAGARILLGGANFGCGSSREHAVWALAEYGFRAVIAEGFSPIFYGNCVRNGLLPVELDPRPLAGFDGEIDINLPAQTVRAVDVCWHFDIDAESKLMLTEGLDPVALTLRLADEINAHERADRPLRPWAWNVLPETRR